MHSVLALFRERVSLLKALRWLSPNSSLLQLGVSLLYSMTCNTISYK
jgi:hypothetical protein